MTHLGLGSNEVESVAPLRALTALESLDLATNRIADLSPSEGCRARPTWA
ncbi:leucine-rich repeat domain-containing protein [Tessaracoccus coleopterorum]